jgi:hypothetical protein
MLALHRLRLLSLGQAGTGEDFLGLFGALAVPSGRARSLTLLEEILDCHQ